MISIIVHGMPGPQGSKKAVGRDGKGRAILVESSKKVRPWRDSVKAACREVIEAGAVTIDEPVWCRMVFTMPKPKSAPKTRRTWPSSRPDLSKLERSTEDAIVDSGLLREDSRIVEYLRAAKVFPNEDPEALQVPGVRIEIWRAHELAYAYERAAEINRKILVSMQMRLAA